MLFGRIIDTVNKILLAYSQKNNISSKLVQLRKDYQLGNVEESVFKELSGEMIAAIDLVESFGRALPQKLERIKSSIKEAGYTEEFVHLFCKRLEYAVNNNIELSYTNSYKIIFMPMLDLGVKFTEAEFVFWLQGANAYNICNLAKQSTQHFTEDQFVANALLANSENIGAPALRYILKKVDIVRIAHTLDNDMIVRLLSNLELNENLSSQFIEKNIFAPLETKGILLITEAEAGAATKEDQSGVEELKCEAADDVSSDDQTTHLQLCELLGEMPV